MGLNIADVDQIIKDHIEDMVIDGRQYYVLIMDKFNIVETYRKDKYHILEILQDIDMINENRATRTHYYEEYNDKYMITIPNPYGPN
mgnify:FL=1